MLSASQKLIRKDCIDQSFTSIIQYGTKGKPQQVSPPICGSVYLDSSQIQQPPEWMLRTQAEILHSLSTCGLHAVQKNSLKPNVLIWNSFSQGLDLMPSAQLALVILHYLPQTRRVHMLQGGIQGFESANEDENLSVILLEITDPVEAEEQTGPGREIIRGQEYVREMLQANTGQLVDVRSLEQWQGTSSGYQYSQRKGRIHGAIFHGIYGPQSDSQRNPGYSLQQCHSHFIDKWKDQGIQLGAEIVLYCGNGWRASLILVCALLKGVRNISLYSNGWIQWSRSSHELSPQSDPEATNIPKELEEISVLHSKGQVDNTVLAQGSAQSE